MLVFRHSCKNDAHNFMQYFALLSPENYPCSEDTSDDLIEGQSFPFDFLACMEVKKGWSWNIYLTEEDQSICMTMSIHKIEEHEQWKILSICTSILQRYFVVRIGDITYFREIVFRVDGSCGFRYLYHQ